MNSSLVQRIYATLIVVLMVPITVTPGADAYHLTDGAGLPESLPSVPEDVWQDTGITPIDRIGDDAEGGIGAVNDASGSTYRIIKNQAENHIGSATKDVPMQPLQLLRDGAGGRDLPEDHPDRRWGGFGEWYVLGDSAWDNRTKAARTGDVGYTQATGPGGTYLSNTRSLLVSPEIDLDTNFFHDDRLGSPQQPEHADTFSLLQTACDTVGRLFVDAFRNTVCDAYQQLVGVDPLYSFEYTLRYNLAAQQPGVLGTDGVTVLVFEGEGGPPKTMQDAEACALTPPRFGPVANNRGTCTVATPAEGYPVGNVTTMPIGSNGMPSVPLLGNPLNSATAGYPGYSGSSDWVPHTIDLAPWEGRSVWIGFLFTSGSFPPQSYFGGTDFDQNLDFYGFQMDDLHIRATAAPYNLKARTAIEPSFVPQGRAIPTLAPGEPFTAKAEVVNLGVATIDVNAVLRIVEVDPSTGDLTVVNDTSTEAPYEFRVPSQEFGPGEILEMALTLQDGLPTGQNYAVHVCSTRVGQGGDEDFCDRGADGGDGIPVPRNESDMGACSEDSMDADLCDQVPELHPFRIDPVWSLAVGDVQRGATKIQSGDSTTMSVEIVNQGNMPQTVHVVPSILTVQPDGTLGSNDDDQKMLWQINNSIAEPTENAKPRTITLDRGESAGPLQGVHDVHLPAWEVRGLSQGQYHFMVDVLPDGMDPQTDVPPLDGERDGLPSMLQPWRPKTLEPDVDIKLDGHLDVAWKEWADVALFEGGAVRYLGNTHGATGGDYLYMAFERMAAERIELRFADAGSGGEPRTDGATGVAVDGDGVHLLRFNGSSLQWEEPPQATDPAIQGARFMPDATYQFELKIPIGVGAGKDGLKAGPGDVVPFMLRRCATDAGQPSCPLDGHFPLWAPLRDGDGFSGANGALADEVEQWQRLVLSDAPVVQGISPVRKVGASLGVGTEEAPFFKVDLMQDAVAGACPSLYGWGTNAVTFLDSKDKWNCGAYADAGNRTVLYQGLSPDSQCEGPCLQYATLAGEPRTMYTRPFQVPLDARDPVVTLSHQYSTEVDIDDSERRFMDENRVIHRSMPQVFLEEWNEATGAFEEVALLVPEGGFPSEADTGIDDPRFDRTFIEPGQQWMNNTDDPRGWWWPQGDQPYHQPIDAAVDVGSHFTGGSPWTTDILPLHGVHYNTAVGGDDITVDVGGSTVRLRFDHVFRSYAEMGDLQMNGKGHSAVGVNNYKGGGAPVEVGDTQSPSSQLLLPVLSDQRPFTAVCTADTSDADTSDHYVLLSVHPEGCAGNVTVFDVVLPSSDVETVAFPVNAMDYFWLPAGTHDLIENTTTNPERPWFHDVPMVVGQPYTGSLSDGLVIDWVDVDGDGKYSYLDAVYLNLGATNRVGPDDIRISIPPEGMRGNRPGIQMEPGLTYKDGVGPGSTYCGTTRCGPTASVATVEDIVFVDRNGDGVWSPTVTDARYDKVGYGSRGGQCTPGDDSSPCPNFKTQKESPDYDKAFLPARVLNGERYPTNEAQDWGWRIGAITAMDGTTVGRDLQVESVTVRGVAASQDAAIGPGTTVQVDVRVHNRGAELANAIVTVEGEELDTDAMACTGDERISIHPETSQDVTVQCPMSDAIAQGRIMFRAHVRLPAGGSQEALMGNNLERARGEYLLEARPDVAVTSLQVSPQDDEAGTTRSVVIALENTGNVPLSDVDVHLDIHRRTNDGPVPIIETRTLSLKAPDGVALPLGARITLSPNNVVDAGPEDFKTTPGQPGLYIVSVRAAAPGDVDAGNDRSDARMSVSQVLYKTLHGNEPTVAVPGVVDGTLAIDDGTGTWALQGNSHDGSEMLAAGDTDLNEIPVGTDSSIYLPTIDLRLVSDATLSFKHRYDLEEHFDGARVEASTDGGKTWSPITPRPQAQNGLDEGHPSIRFLGAEALLDGQAECTACVFTGRSGDLPNSDNGWLTAEYDLTDQPQFLVPADIAGFDIRDKESHPLSTPLQRERNGGPADIQFTHLGTKQAAPDGPVWHEDQINTLVPSPSSWAIDGPQWFENEQYWWIDNLTYSQPAPLNEGRMWWSGSAGEAMAGTDQPNVETTLSLALDASTWEDLGSEELVLSWWDWRAGWRDGPHREGTGGIFDVQTPDGASRVRIVERLDDGWTRREVVLPASGQNMGVMFHYTSGEALGDEYKIRNVPVSQIENNLGWFIAGAELLRRDPAGDTQDVLDLHPVDLIMNPNTGSAGDWTRSVQQGPTAWSLVDRGAAARDGAWHITPMNHPAHGTIPTWRFASDDHPEGYPANANSRLVTPRVDLRDYREDTATLRFDHQYGFHGGGKSQNIIVDHAVDAGTVVVQVYDSHTDSYGPWMPFGAQSMKDPVPFSSYGVFDREPADRLLEDIASMEYPAVLTNPGYIKLYRDQFGRYPLESTDAGFGFIWGRGVGADLPTTEGIYRPQESSADSHQAYWRFIPEWVEHPFAYVFTGDQHEWQTVEWDISPFIGEQVRFGFQAWTNPSDHPCRTGPGAGDLATEYNTPEPCAGNREGLRGWAIADIAVAGQAFQGTPVDLRLHLATDGSDPKGTWNIDDIKVTGTRYDEAFVIQATDVPTAVRLGTDWSLDGTLSNVGAVERNDLAIAVSARVKEPKNAQDHILTPRIVRPDVTPVDPALLPTGIASAHGSFDLSSGGLDGSTTPFRVDLPVPDFSSTVVVQMQILQRSCDGCDDFRPIRNEAGPSIHSWTVAVEERLDIRFEPPTTEQDDPLIVTPMDPAAGDKINVTARLANRGVVEPAPEATWTLVEVLRRGDSSQKGIDPESTQIIEKQQVALPVLRSGEERDMEFSFEPPRDGLYRVILDLELDKDNHRSQTVEFLVGEPSPYYAINFATDDAVAHGWKSFAPGVMATGQGGMGGSPDAIRFRQVDGQYLWGVTDQQYADGRTYCSFGGCNHPRGDGRKETYGLLGEARDDRTLVDLGRAPHGVATLVLDQSHAFDPEEDAQGRTADGGRIEVLPLRSPVVNGVPDPAFRCTNGQQTVPMWFALLPDGNTSQDAVVLSMQGIRGATDPRGSAIPPVSGRVNPINDQQVEQKKQSQAGDDRLGPTRPLAGTIPVFAGDPLREVVQYDLTQSPEPICPLRFDGDDAEYRLEEGVSLPDTLSNYTLQLRLRTGTLPGFTWNCDQPPQTSANFCRMNGEVNPQLQRTDGRDGGQGWKIHSILASSTGVDITPEQTTLPVRDGFPKRFQYQVTNTGSIPGTFQVSVDPTRTAIDPSWFDFPTETVRLAPGQSAPFTFHVTVPSGTAQGTHPAILHMASTAEPLVRDTIHLDLRLADEPLPDLTVGLSVEGAALVPEVEQDTVAVISVPVRNIGSKESDPVDLVLEVEHDNQTSVITTRSIDPLCPAQECGSVASQDPVTVEWKVPRQIGEYTLHARVDPQGRLVESSKDQNNASLVVHVVPLQRPDVAITDVTFLGAAPDGYVLEGDLVRIVADVTNVGVEPATQVKVRILSGGATLWTETIDTIAPGETRQVNATRFATRGESLVQAVATMDQDPVTENNAMGRILRTRGVDMQLTPQDTAPIVMQPGGTGSALVNVINHGNLVERITFALDPDHQGWGIAASPHPVPVAANSTAWTMITLQSPEDASAGSHAIRVLGAPQSRPEATAATVLNVIVATAGDGPILTIAENQTIGDVTAHLLSRSNADERLQLRLVEPADWTMAARNVTLPANGTVETSLHLVAPASAAPGATRVHLHALDADGDLRTEAQAMVWVPRSIAADAAWTGDERIPSNDLTVVVHGFRVNVTNLGNVPFQPDLVAVALSDGSTQLDLKDQPILAPGASADVPVHIETAVDRVEELRGRVELWARAGNDTPTQPVAVLNIPSLHRPDLVVERVRITPSGEVQVGEPVRIVATIANQGALPMNESRMYAYVNGDLVHVLPVEAIPAGEQVQVNVTWSFTETGSHLVHLQGNGDGQQEETYMDNNGRNVVIQVNESRVSRFLDDAVDIPGPTLPVLLVALGLAAIMLRRRQEGGGP